MESSNKARKPKILLNIIVFIILSTGGGIIAGIIFGIIGSFIYLIVIFPLLMGLVGGLIVSENAKATKTRNIFIIVCTSILTVIMAYISFHYMRYIGLSINRSIQKYGDLSDKSLESGWAFTEYALQQETGHYGFIGYILYKAQQGITIGRIFSSNKLILGPIFTWIYWIIEILIISFITVFIGKQNNRKPFCEYCYSWYPGKKHIGGVNISKESDIMECVKQREFTSIGTILEENAETPSLEFYLESCNTCNNHNSTLIITRANIIQGKITTKDISKIILIPTEKKNLVEGK